MTSTAPVQQELAGLPPRPYAGSPSRLLAWLDCPRRYRMQYLDRPKPQARPQRAHTSVGVAVHNALRDWWDLGTEQRTPPAGMELVRTSWIDLGWRDPAQSARWRARSQQHVGAYLDGVDGRQQPLGIERTVSFRTEGLRLTGRVDRLDERDDELVVVDYKTGRVQSSEEEARTSLPLALYAAAVWKMFRRRCVRVELHHVPTGTVAVHEHSPQSLSCKVDEARSIAFDARRADADYAEMGLESAMFPARVGPICQWCDFRAHCPEGAAHGPEKSSWAALDGEEV